LKATRNDILIEFWESQEVNHAISKMQPIELQEELKSELFLRIAEIPEDKLIDLYNKKQLRFYVVRIMLNLIRSTDHKFYKKFRNFVEYVPIEEIENEQVDVSNYVREHYESLYWYDQEIFRLYTFQFDCNAKKLSHALGIPYISVVRTINKIKKDLKTKIRGND
jgi:hypothetical protein